LNADSGFEMIRVEYLRVSVTDRCNLRCVFCRPAGDCDFLQRQEILRFDEIHRIVRLLAEYGVRRVRLTGGEPLMRRNIASLVRRLAATQGVEDLAITTNGVLLERMAAELKAAGLNRVNVGLSSAQRQNYRDVTGFDFLPQVIRGVNKAIEAGLMPVKVNAVLLKGLNDDQIIALAGMSIEMPAVVRFIEYCPTTGHTRPATDYIPNSVVRRIIERRFGTLSDTVIGYGGGPASYLRIAGSAGAIGFINCRSSCFCHTCNRLRLTSDGRIKPCLYSAVSYDMRGLLRGHADDEQVRGVLGKILDEKHRYTKLNSFSEEFCMRKIGG